MGNPIPPEDEGMVIEFTAPANFGICYLEAALKIGMASLTNSRSFIELAGNRDATQYMREAEESMEVLIQCIAEGKAQVFQFLAQSSSQSSDTSSEEEEEETIPEFPGSFAKPGAPDNTSGPMDDD